MNGARGGELNFDGTCCRCDAPAVAGQTKCRRHRDRDNSGNRVATGPISAVLLLPAKVPPPAWMVDPTLLPKRPPGRAA